MQEKINRIRELLDRQLFVLEAKKKEVLNSLGNLSENKINKLLTLLEKGDEAQAKVLTGIIKKNPNFLSEVNGILTHEVMGEIHDKEREYFENSEKNVLASLEDEISHLS